MGSQLNYLIKVNLYSSSLRHTPKQKATTLAILHVPRAILWPTGLVVDRIWSAYAACDDVSVPGQNILVESGY